MNRLKTYTADLLIVAGFLILPLLLYGQVTLGGRTMLPADNLFQWQPWSSAAPAYNAEIPQNSLISDLVLENYAWKRFIRQSIEQGEIPLWNPYLFAGTPFLATGQHSAYYPFSLLFLILPLVKAYGWYTVSQLWLAGTLMYAFGRILGLRRASAALAGLVYQGCGFMIVSAAVFPMIIGAAAWLPLLLACIEMVVRQSTAEQGGRTLPWAVLGAIALGCQILAGHIEITYYTLLVMAFYAAWRLFTHHASRITHHASRITHHASHSSLLALRSSLKPSLWLLSFVFTGLLLGAVQFIPLYEVAQANFREGSASLEEIRGWAFPPRRVLALALPNFFGNPTHHRYTDVLSGRTEPFTTNYYGELNPHGANSSDWGIKNYVEGGIYLGILPLFLSLLGVWGARQLFPQRRPQIAFFVTLALLSFAFIFGTPLYALLYYGLPGINQLHSPFRWVFPLSLCLAALAGYGADYLAATRLEKSQIPNPKSQTAGQGNAYSVFRIPYSKGSNTQYAIRNTSLITGLAGLAFWAGLLLLLGLFLSRAFYTSLEPLIERLFLGLAQAADAFPTTRAFYSYEFRQFFLLGLMLVAAGCVLRVSRCPIYLRRRPIWEWMAAVALGLDLLVAGYGFNAAVDPALLAYQPALAQWLEEQPGLWRLTTFAPNGGKPFNANAGWFYNLSDVRGYDSIILKQYTDYMAAIEPQNELPFNRVQPIANWQSLNSPLLDLLGVKYIITAETLNLPKLQQVWQGEGLRVYENLAAVPRAITLPATATIVVEDALAAVTTVDPRFNVIVEQQNCQLPITNCEISNLQSPISNLPTPTPADLLSYSNIEALVNMAVTEPSWLVLHDTYFVGWRAYVRPVGAAESEEREVQLFRVNGNFRGVLLEPGDWTVRFRYSPNSFKLGGLASFMGGTILLFALAVWAWRRFYTHQGELSNTRSIAKNSLAPMFLNLFNRAIDFVFAAFYLRLLGPADAGSYATAIAIAGWFEIISNFGLNTLVIREVSLDKNQAGRYLLNTSLLRILTTLLGGLPIAVYVAGIELGSNPLNSQTIAAILLLMLGMIFSGVGQSVAGLFYAFEKAETPAAIATVTTICKVGFGVIVLLIGYGFVGLAAVSILVNVITLAILLWAAFRNFPMNGPWQVDIPLQRQMLIRSYPLMLNHLFAVIFFQIDVPLLRQFNGEAVVGWYNSAYKWVNALNVIPSFFTFALFPVISRQVNNSVDDARRTFRMSVKLLVLVALPLAAVTTFTADYLIGLLGGPEFLPQGATALRIVIWSIPFGWINSVTNYVLIALGQERVQTRAFLLGVAFNLIANLLFLPRYSFVAAAVITIASEIVLLAIFNYYLQPKMPNVRWLDLLWRPVLVTAATLLAMWFGWLLHPLLALLFGVVVYPAGLWLLRVFGSEERRIVQSILPASLVARLKLAS